MKDGRINDNEAKKIFKTLEDMEGSKIDYSKLVYKSNLTSLLQIKKMS